MYFLPSVFLFLFCSFITVLQNLCFQQLFALPFLVCFFSEITRIIFASMTRNGLLTVSMNTFLHLHQDYYHFRLIYPALIFVITRHLIQQHINLSSRDPQFMPIMLHRDGWMDGWMDGCQTISFYNTLSCECLTTMLLKWYTVPHPTQGLVCINLHHSKIRLFAIHTQGRGVTPTVNNSLSDLEGESQVYYTLGSPKFFNLDPRYS